MKKIICFAVMALMISQAATVNAAIPYMSLGFVPYPSFGYWRLDEEGKRFGTFYMQTPYIPSTSMPVIGNPLYFGNESVPGFERPMDLFVDGDDFLYVVDSTQNRVVKMTEQGFFVREYGTREDCPGRLHNPEGVYVRNETGEVYVCDTGNFRVVVFDNDGEYLREMTKPDDIRIESVLFMPQRISVDSRGFYVLLSKGENRGLMLLTPNWEFNGFFGANVTQLTVFEKLRARVYSYSQRLATQRVQDAISDMFIDSEGFIYTATSSANDEQIKKFNIGSLNLFRGRQMDVFPISDMRDGWQENIRTAYSSVTVDDRGNIFALDSGSGRVFMFDTFGEPVLSFGMQMMDRSNITVGMFGNPTSIRVNSKGTLFVTDPVYNGILVFSPTPYARQILEINYLYTDGRYNDAVPLAQEILRENVYFIKANMVIGMAHFQSQEWDEARTYFRQAFNTTMYSEAFWESRLISIQNNFAYALVAVLVIVFGFGIKNVITSKRKKGDKP